MCLDHFNVGLATITLVWFTHTYAFSELSEVHRMLETTMNSLSIMFNLFLLYLIRCHSMRQMSTYKLLLTIDASLDLMLAVVCLLTQPVS